MATITVLDLIEVRMFTSIGSQLAINVRQFTVFSILTTPPTYEAATQAIEAKLAAAYKQILSANATWRGVGVRKLLPAPKSLEILNNDSAGAGGAAGDCLPKQACGLLKLGTATAGPGGRGRAYLAFPSELHNGVDGKPNAAYATAAVDLIAALTTNTQFDAAGEKFNLQPLLVKKPGLSSKEITFATLRTKWATQKRRGDYGRVNEFPI